MSREPILYRRHTLYDEVWKEPLLTVSKRYGVSDVAIAKVCRRLAIPLPGRGHWARVVAGQVIERVPLRRLPKSRPDVFLGRRPRPTAASPATHALVEKESTPEARIADHAAVPILRDSRSCRPRSHRDQRRMVQIASCAASRYPLNLT